MRLEFSPAEREARLAGFLARLAPVATILGLVEAWAGVRFRNHQTFDSAGVILLFAGVVLVASRICARGRAAVACALTVSALVVAALVLVWIQPELHPFLALVPLLGVLLALPFLEGRRLAALLGVAVVTVATISWLGRVLPPTPRPPRSFNLLFEPLAIAVLAAFLGYLLWLYADRVEARLNDELSRSQRLESVIRELSGREREARQSALRDPLTGLANRRLFLDRLEEAMGGLSRGSHEAGLLFLDLDRFKEVNDHYGHAAGDQVLVAVARTLAGAVRSTDTLARMGGDEFALVMPRIDAPSDAEQVARRLLERAGQPLVGPWGRYSPSLSIGIAAAPGHAQDAAGLLRAADTAMYAVKKRGGGGFAWLDPQLELPLRRRRSPASSSTGVVAAEP